MKRFVSLTCKRRQEMAGTELVWLVQIAGTGSLVQGTMRNSSFFYLPVLPVSVHGCYFMVQNGCLSTCH